MTKMRLINQNASKNGTKQENAIVVVDFNLISEYKTKNRVKLNISSCLFLTQICNIKLA